VKVGLLALDAKDKVQFAGIAIGIRHADDRTRAALRSACQQHFGSVLPSLCVVRATRSRMKASFSSTSIFRLVKST
jgi:hypothetical protein